MPSLRRPSPSPYPPPWRNSRNVTIWAAGVALALLGLCAEGGLGAEEKKTVVPIGLFETRWHFSLKKLVLLLLLLLLLLLVLVKQQLLL